MRNAERRAKPRKRHAKTLALIAAALLVINELHNYWALTLRQIHYQLVDRGIIKNTEKEYNRLGRTLADARIDGLVPWRAMEDRHRHHHRPAVCRDAKIYLGNQLDEIGEGYRRDLQANQPVALEVWTEKDGLAPLLQRVAFQFSVPVVVAVGFSSVSYKHDAGLRIEKRARQGRKTRILYVGDWDPAGWCMPIELLEYLQVTHGVGDLVSLERVALNPDQIEEYNLRESIDALKMGDTRAKRFIQENGPGCVELDALLRVNVLEDVLREAIERNLVKTNFDVDQDTEAREDEWLADAQDRIREKFEVFVAELYDEYDEEFGDDEEGES